MKVRIKRLCEGAVMPCKAHEGDAGFDLFAVSRVFDAEGNVVYGTGLAFEIPQGYVGLVFPRSSICRYDLALSNSVGVIDSGYRGEVMLKFRPTLVVVDDPEYFEPSNSEDDYNGTVQTDWGVQDVTFHGRSDNYPDIRDGCLPFQPRLYEVGERIGQLMIVPYPDVEFEEADELSDSERGKGGYGSSGR